MYITYIIQFQEIPYLKVKQEIIQLSSPSKMTKQKKMYLRQVDTI
jgi:hypothetical protein